MQYKGTDDMRVITGTARGRVLRTLEGEVLGEKVDSFAEIPVTEDGCLQYGLGMIILERV